MEKVVNQLGQTVEFTQNRTGVILAKIENVHTVVGTDMNVFFKDSEFNPVLLADGTIIPHYRYNGQPVEVVETVNICKCNNCDAVLIDENPQTDAPLFPLEESFQFMEQFQDEGGTFWGCPNCETDGYLMDIE